MHLTKIHIEGFRGVSSAELDGFKQINVFVGKNNCGKTSILESVFLLCGMTNPELVLRISNQRDLTLNEEDDLRFIFNNLDYSSNLLIRGEFDEKSHQRELQIRPQAPSVKKVNPQKNSNLDSNLTTEEINRLDFLSSIKEIHKQKTHYESKLTCNQGNFSIEVPKNYREQIRTILLPPRWTTALNLEKKLEDLMINKQLSSIISVLKKVDSSIQAVTLGSNRMIYVDVGLTRLIPINLLGDGLKRLLSILLSMADAKDGIVLIDEIDNGLHFSVQQTLWRAIIEGCIHYNVQLFCTTHNYETLRNLSLVADTDVPEFKNEIKCFTIRKSGNQTLSYPYDFDKLEFAIQQGIEFR